ncbi:hypothetical protein [uncultured Bacteroides sp.]|uniref:hypothetical protein n=1 Tax=uncultured Bacteroides sp. TaxID=162156 RepID=UPI0025D64086|nr:hypothetical protein [uncultured Bacteroides sp.]
MKQKNKLKPIFFIYTIFAVLFGLLAGPPEWIQWDTASYIKAGEVFLDGKLDVFRTPVYPLLISFFRMLLGDWFSTGLIIVQVLAFILSVYCFSILCSYYVKNHLIYIITVALYAFHPTILIWHKLILTESLSISLMVIFVYLFVKFIRENTYSSLILSQISLIFLVFLRPAFIYLLPLNIIFFIYLVVKKRYLRSLVGLISAVIVAISFGYYCYSFEKEYGIFGSSNVSDVNQFWILSESGLIDFDAIQNEQMKSDVKKFQKVVLYRSDYIILFQILQQRYGLTLCHEMVKNSIKNNIGAYVKYRIRNFWKEGICSLGCWEEQRDLLTRISLFVSLNFFQYIVFLIVYLVLFFRFFCKTEMCMLSICLFFIAIGGLFVAVAGAPVSWGRLAVTCVPVSFLLFGQVLDLLYTKLKCKEC